MSQHYLFRLIANNLAAFRKLGADPYTAIAHNPKWDSIAIRLHLASRLLPGKPVNPNDTVPIADFGRLWNAMIQRTQLIFRDLPRERVHHLRFEDLQADPAPHLASLIRFAGPDLNDPDWISAASKLPRPQTPRFPTLRDYSHHRIALRSTMALLGRGLSSSSTRLPSSVNLTVGATFHRPPIRQVRSPSPVSLTPA